MSLKKAVFKVKGIITDELNKQLKRGEFPKTAWELTVKFTYKHMQTHPKDRLVWRIALDNVGEDFKVLLGKTRDEIAARKKVESEELNEPIHQAQ